MKSIYICGVVNNYENMKEIEKSIKKTKKRITLGANVARGKIAEGLVEGSYRPYGYIKKRHKGRDFDFRRANMLTGEVSGPLEMIEVKAGKSILSESQEKMKRKMKKKRLIYREKRIPI